MTKPKLKRIALTQQAHDFIAGSLFSGAIAIDATAGNGFDTCFLAKHVGDSGHTYAFDIQADALSETRNKLATIDKTEHVTLIHASHILIQDKIPKQHAGNIQAVMFNLGYLPGFSHQTTTQSDDTLIALQHAANMLAPEGRISILAYTGHTGGREETDAVKAWAKALSQDMFTVKVEIPVVARTSPPELIQIIKRRGHMTQTGGS